MRRRCSSRMMRWRSIFRRTRRVCRLGRYGTATELLVAAVPFVKGLGAQRRAAEKAARAARKAQGQAGPERPVESPALSPGMLTPRALANRVGPPGGHTGPPLQSLE